MYTTVHCFLSVNLAIGISSRSRAGGLFFGSITSMHTCYIQFTQMIPQINQYIISSLLIYENKIKIEIFQCQEIPQIIFFGNTSFLLKKIILKVEF